MRMPDKRRPCAWSSSRSAGTCKRTGASSLTPTARFLWSRSVLQHSREYNLLAVVKEGLMFRVALIGLGALTRNIHLPAYAQMKDGLTIVGGCDVDPSAQDLVRGKWKLPHVCRDVRELIDKTKPDIVSVCT